MPKERRGSLWGSRIIRNVSMPSLLPYVPRKPNGTAVIVVPGGVFQFLAIQKEGTEVAEWLNALGITAFVLKYRLAPTPADDAEFRAAFEASNFDIRGIAGYIRQAVEDGIESLRAVRRISRRYRIRKGRIGMIGFSAGALIAVNGALKSAPKPRPDFLAAIYGAPIRAVKATKQAPPLFMAFADDDALVADNCPALYQAWKKAGRPVEIHAYAKGGHGFGMAKQKQPSSQWPASFEIWLRGGGFLPQK
ncbi:MAG: dienelactone hydrolase family protein [Anaerolineales bacterium]|nr:dienelactone hydrolase family protein [Anaerolineales bacterium]